MSFLYNDAAYVLNNYMFKKKLSNESIKSMIYSDKVRNKSKTMALVAGVLQHRDHIEEIMKKCKSVGEEKIQNRGLLCVLLYELFYGQKVIKGGGVVKKKIYEHLTELEDAFKNISETKEPIAAHNGSKTVEPSTRVKYLRVNLLKTSVEEALQVLQSNISAASETKECGMTITVDNHLPYLLILRSVAAPSASPQESSVSFNGSMRFLKQLYQHELVVSGKIILQNKSSCLPAHLLFNAVHESKMAMQEKQGGQEKQEEKEPTMKPVVDFIDATAAPGNKTSQLAMLIEHRRSQLADAQKSIIYAFDKDKKRFMLLKRRMTELVDSSLPRSFLNCFHQDFLKTDPFAETFQHVRGILVDPSCSGSGMRDRFDRNSKVDSTRLEKLHQFQVSCVLHAMKFPAVQFISYSTCSIHVEENEAVVQSVLSQNDQFVLEKINLPTMKTNEKQLPNWSKGGVSGTEKGITLTSEQLSCLLRVDPAVDEAIGFFVALFRRLPGTQVQHRPTKQSLPNQKKRRKQSTEGRLPGKTQKKQKKKRRRGNRNSVTKQLKKHGIVVSKKPTIL